MVDRIRDKLELFHSIYNVHASMNILDHTRLGHELFWRLLEACSDEISILHIKHINADGFAGTSALRRVIRILENNGWVVVETHPDDARARVVRATQKLVDHADQCYIEFDKRLEKYLLSLQSVAMAIH